MATFTPTFRTASRKVHAEHEELQAQLLELESALEELAGDSEVVANLAAAERVCRCGWHLAELLPGHMAREESTLLGTVARISPELDEFAREMCHEHQRLRTLLVEFRGAVENLACGRNLEDTIWRVREVGMRLIRELGEHVALEETELGGFL